MHSILFDHRIRPQLERERESGKCCIRQKDMFTASGNAAPPPPVRQPLKFLQGLSVLLSFTCLLFHGKDVALITQYGLFGDYLKMWGVGSPGFLFTYLAGVLP